MKLLGRHLVELTWLAGSQFLSWGLLLGDSALGPTKTGLYDEAVLIDLDRWFKPVLEVLHLCVSPNSSLWIFTYPEWVKAFSLACNALRLQALLPQIYSLRHGGASEDFLTQRRTLSEIKIRGRWASDSSLKRYTKATQLQAFRRKVPPHVFTLGRQVLKDFPLALQGQLRT